MAEWSNAPDSKSGVQVYLYRGFESLSFRQSLNSYFTNSKKFNCWDAQGFFCFANISSIHRSSAFASCLKDSISDGESIVAVCEQSS